MSERKHAAPPNRGGHPGGRPGMPVQKPKNAKKSLRNLLAYLGPFKSHIVAVAILAILASIFSIVGPKVLALATDELASGLKNMMSGVESGIDFGYIRNIMLILIGLYVISAMFSYIQGHVMANVATRVSFNLRNALMKKVNRLPLHYFNDTKLGDVLSRITNDVDTIEQSLSQSITQILTSLATVIGVLIMMFSISWQMTLVALIVMPLSVVFVMFIFKFSQKHFVNQQVYLGKVNGQVEEMYGGHLVLKAFNGEDRAIKQFEQDNEILAQSAKKAEFLSGLLMPIMMFIGNLGYVLVCIVGAFLASNGRVTIGDIQAFIQYVRSFTQPLSQLSNMSNQIQRMLAAAERVFEFLDEEEEKEVEVRYEAGKQPIKGDISFEHVSFGYSPDETIIRDFTLDVHAGQKVAIVGPTGSGKTTLVKLLMRFYDVNSGAIKLDGMDIREFDRHDLRTMFAMVLQDTWLFNGTVLENIRYGQLNATDDEVMEAAVLAQADSFIRTLPNGYQMELNEETSNISQGQKQLLTIARAILADPRVLILDEATSSVDTRTEVLIQKAMDELMKGRTSFIIAHRLSTIKNADVILCLKDGEIVEKGTHEELLAQNGFYAQLYYSQFDQVG